MSFFQARHESAAAPTDLAHRGLRLITSINNKVSEFETQRVTAADIIFKRCATKLAELPVVELDATHAELARYIEKNGDSVVRCFYEDHRLTDILQQLSSTQEQLRPYREHIPK